MTHCSTHAHRRSPLFRSTADGALPRASSPRPSRSKAHVRALTPNDLDRVVELHREGFGTDERKVDLQGFLGSVFFEHPWRDDRLPSLAYVDGKGTVIGCIGVMPRPMLLDGRPIQAVVTHNFVVTSGQRASLAAIRLMRAVMAAAPDLILADSNDPARKLSEALGARTVSARSDRWYRVLRPAGLGVHLANRSWSGGIPESVNRALTGLSAAPDAIARMLPGSPVRVPGGDRSDEVPDPMTLVELMERLTGHLALRPDYTPETLGWLLETLARTRQKQSLKLGVVRDGDQRVGWYVYYSRPGGVGRVLQLGAAAGFRGRVLDHLFADALREGDVAVSGQSDPAWATALKEASCRTRPGGSWMVLHTANPRIDRVLETSDAFLSRLEGEAWMHFGY
jgi:hypothetical protein